MLRSILILGPPGSATDDLRAAFDAETSADCRVSVVPALDDLLRRVPNGGEPPLVVIDERQADGNHSGLDLIPLIRKQRSDVPVVVVAEAGSVDAAARAIQAGAADFLVRGERLGERIATLLGKLQRLFAEISRSRLLDEQNARLRDALGERSHIVGDSLQIRQLMAQIERVACVPRPVLIAGERGTGKELVARAIHALALGPSRPMVVVNCAAFSDALLESELFGHEKGSFTGAETLRHGKFEMSDGGTLFLDEIGNMSLSFQQKILRVVEYGTYTRVGGDAEMKTTARTIAATNCDLHARMQARQFLPDLYDRLTFDVIEVPPLRQRTGDVEVLARHFLTEFAREIPALAGKTVSPPALAALNRYAFPGNVRELKNIIERAAYQNSSIEIGADDLGLRADHTEAGRGTFDEQVDAFRKHLLVEAMNQSHHNQAAAARRLGLTYHQFRYYYKKLVIDYSE